MPRISPSAVRLVCRVANARPPSPPFGLSAFTADGDALAVLLDLAAESPPRAQVDEAFAQIPDADSLPEGCLVVVLPERATARGVFKRLFGAWSAPQIPRSVRATALLARGYGALGAGKDDVSGADLVWGTVPPRS